MNAIHFVHSVGGKRRRIPRSALRIATISVWFGIVFCGPSPAQSVRYELGLRLRALEVEWDSASAEDKQRALPSLQASVADFFRLRLSDAARGLDHARLALIEVPIDGPAAWCSSFAVQPDARFAATRSAGGSFGVTLDALYDSGIATPADAWAAVSLVGTDGTGLVHARIELDAAAPRAAQLALDAVPAGDHQLVVQWHVGSETWITRRIGCSFARDAQQRVAAARERVSAGTGAPALELATAERLTDLLERSLAGEVQETDYPYNRLLSELESVSALEADQRFYDRRRAGEFWLRVPSGGRETDVRVFSPAAADEAQRPCVIALHGAGGSDNMFFDGYGNGAAVRLATERGWVFIAPRAPLFGNVDVEGIIDVLAPRYGLDRQRVFLLGHSMGAVQAHSAARRSVDRFAAMALIGGGRPSRDDARCAQLPAYIAAGSEDFGLSGARALHASLTKLGGEPQLDVRPGIEHLTIVQETLKAAFEFFDEVGAEAGGR